MPRVRVIINDALRLHLWRSCHFRCICISCCAKNLYHIYQLFVPDDENKFILLKSDLLWIWFVSSSVKSVAKTQFRWIVFIQEGFSELDSYNSCPGEDGILSLQRAEAETSLFTASLLCAEFWQLRCNLLLCIQIGFTNSYLHDAKGYKMHQAMNCTAGLVTKGGMVGWQAHPKKCGWLKLSNDLESLHCLMMMILMDLIQE